MSPSRKPTAAPPLDSPTEESDPRCAEARRAFRHSLAAKLAARPPATKVKSCSNCGEDFQARKSRQGRFNSTCSPECRLEAFDRLIASLSQKRDELAAQILAGGEQADRERRRRFRGEG